MRFLFLFALGGFLDGISNAAQTPKKLGGDAAITSPVQSSVVSPQMLLIDEDSSSSIGLNTGFILGDSEEEVGDLNIGESDSRSAVSSIDSGEYLDFRVDLGSVSWEDSD